MHLIMKLVNIGSIFLSQLMPVNISKVNRSHARHNSCVAWIFDSYIHVKGDQHIRHLLLALWGPVLRSSA